MPTEGQTPTGAESELRETDLHDATATLDRKRLQIVRLSAIAFLVLLWVGLEATPLGAMLLAVLSIVPLKRAVKEYLALSAQRVQLIGGLGSERDDEPGAGTA